MGKLPDSPPPGAEPEGKPLLAAEGGTSLPDSSWRRAKRAYSLAVGKDAEPLADPDGPAALEGNATLEEGKPPEPDAPPGGPP